jgi:sugar/nucleoside kinase (ribokinase family)
VRVLVVGDVASDVLVRPTAPAVPGADVPARIVIRPGGAGANTAAWLAHLGADVTMAARVGDDAPGRAAAADLAAAGVDAHLAVDEDAPTATVVALLDGADRTLLSDRGAAARLAPADLPALHGFDHLHVSGYVLLDESSRPAGLAAVAAARAAGVPTSVDPQVAPALTPAFLDDVAGIALLLPNAAELAALGGIDAVLERCAAVAWTTGPGGASWGERREVCSVTAAPVEVVDATGAGDAFNAGVLVARMSGASARQALDSGCAAAASAVSRLGARPVRPQASRRRPRPR